MNNTSDSTESSRPENHPQEAFDDVSDMVMLSIRSVLDCPEEAEQDFRHLLDRIHDLAKRRLRQRSTKNETRDLLAEVLFSRLTRAFTSCFQKVGLNNDPREAATLLMGSLMTGTVLADIAQTLDQVLVEMTSPHDYHLAGRADFISINELLQLLNAGTHSGRLIFEKSDNQIDVYILNGSIAFVDPHRLHQRMIRGKGMNKWREIPIETLAKANGTRTTEGIPILLTLCEEGFLSKDEVGEHLRAMGAQQIYSCLLDESRCSFSYKQMEMPDFAREHHIGLPVMPLLLEGHRRLDEWRRIRRVFPDLETPIDPAPELFACIAEMSLDVIEIRVLTLVNGENSFQDIQESIGMDPFDLGQLLVHFGREGILMPPGGRESLFEKEMSTAESIQAATQALDQNEALDAIPESLDNVFGRDEEEFGLGFLRAARDEEAGEAK
ncbi:MAG: DUF4388 domain-containing protein [Planctomycetota bacterium]